MVGEALDSAMCYLRDCRQVFLGVKILPIFLGFLAGFNGVRRYENCLEPTEHIGNVHGGTITMLFHVYCCGTLVYPGKDVLHLFTLHSLTIQRCVAFAFIK